MEKNIAEQSLEALMKRIDEIAKRLGGEDISLEESLALYEEGVSLIRICNDKLSVAERKIKMLKISADGEVVESDASLMGEQ